MRDAEFRAWFSAQDYSPGTVNTQMSKVRKLDRLFGDLDALHANGELDVLEARLRAKRDLPAGTGSGIELDHLPTSLRYYRKFLAAGADPVRGNLGLTRQDILAAVARCDAAGSSEAFIASLPVLGTPKSYWLLHEGKRYPSKAIVRDALRAIGSAALPGGGPCKAALDGLGFAVIDWPGFVKARDTFLERMPGFESFAQEDGSYWEIERRYKNDIIAKAAAIAATGDDDRAAGEAMYRLLSVGQQGLPLQWRTLHEIEQTSSDLRDQFYIAVARMARDSADVPALVAEAAQALEKLRSAGVVGLRRGEVLGIAISVVGTIRPHEASWFKISRIEAMGKVLFNRKLFPGDEFNGASFNEFLMLMRALRDLLDTELGWKPRDLFDVQGFLWVALDDKYSTSDVAAAGLDTPTPSNAHEGPSPMPTNLILYGPPGTGKTYATAVKAVELCGEPTSDDRDAVMAAYRALQQKGRIAFVTFHQSYSYEEFVEGLRPVTGSEGDDEPSAGFSLQPQDGIFKQIADVAASNRGRSAQPAVPVVDRSAKVFKMSLGRARYPEDDAIYQDAIRDGYIVLGWGGDVDWSDARFDEWDAIKRRWREDHPAATSNDPNVSQMYAFRISMQPGALVVVSDGNRKFRAIGQITGPYQFVPGPGGEYNHRRAVRWLWTSEESLPRELIYDKELSQVSAYQMNSRHLNWEGLEQIVASGGEGPVETGAPEPYVLIIDEINRANISKVFGELITLLEPDKRLGMPNALTVTLPYSKKRDFGVPANLHIIGTMNTADRSIALLDTALRRRFEFQELMPQPDLLQPVDGIDLPRLLRTINERVEYLFDREHQIGHAYFIGCASRADVDAVMRGKVIPLLAEYFYEDWSKVALVLGDDGTGANGFVERRELAAPPGLEAEYETAARYRWSVKDKFEYGAFAAA